MDKKLMAVGTSMLLLKLLEEKDMYGYEMIRELEKRSNQVFALKEGTLYPILHSLEEQEAVESYEKVAQSGRRRKYYHMTAKGKKLLDAKGIFICNQFFQLIRQTCRKSCFRYERLEKSDMADADLKLLKAC